MAMNMMLNGWKDLQMASGKSVATLKRWHRKKKRIPFQKSSEAKQGQLTIPYIAFMRWLGEVLVTPKYGDEKTI